MASSGGGIEEQVAPDLRLSDGDLVGERYRLVRPIGRGGMGVVYEAVHETVGRPVALKVLFHRSGLSVELARRFAREAQMASRIRHPNIVDVFDFGIHRGVPFFVMELLEGETLGALLDRQGVLSVRDLIPITDDVLRALAAAHREGIIHRDVKPDNVFLARHASDPSLGTTVKVLDFGIAKWGGPTDTQLTESHVTMGTAAYMSPEHVRSARDVGPAADLYSVGVILYRAVTGRLPHEGSTYNELIVAKVTQEPAPLDSVAPELPQEFCDAVMRSLRQEPGDRFADADAFRQALAACKDLPGLDARLSVDPLGDTLSSQPHPMASGRPGARRRRRLAGAAIGAALTVAALVWSVGAVWSIGATPRETLDEGSAGNAPPPVEVPRGPAGDKATEPGIPSSDTLSPDRTGKGAAAGSAPAPPSGTVTPVVPAKRAIRFESEPSGADILMDETVLCTTPCEADLVPDGPITVAARRRGYRRVERTLKPPFDPIVSLQLRRQRGGSTPRTTTDAVPEEMALPFSTR